MKIFTSKRFCSVIAALCIFIGNAGIINAETGTIASLWSDGEQINYYAPCTDTITLQIDSAKAFGDTDGIKLTNLGTSVYYDTAADVPITASAENNELTIRLSEKLADSNRYELSLPDGFKASDGTDIVPKKFSFKASEKSTASEAVTEINFAGLTNDDLNTFGKRPSNGYIIGNGGLQFTKTAAKTRNEIVTENGCNGDTALKITERGILMNEFAENHKIGKLKVEARFKVNSGKVNFKIGNSSGATSILTAEKDKVSLYRQDKTGENPTEFDAAAPENGYTAISYEMNLTNMSADYTLNGETGSLTSGLLPRFKSSANLLETGFGLVEFETTVAASEYLIDYVRYTVYYDAPDVEKISFTDVDSNNVLYNGTDAVTPSMSEIKIKFNSAMEESALGAITVSDTNGDNISYSAAYDKNESTYFITLPEYLAQNSTYTVSVPKSVRSASGAALFEEISEDFKTGDGEFRILSLYCEDSNGNKVTSIKNLSGGFAIKAEILNTAGLQKKLSLVTAQNKDLQLQKMSYNDIEITGEDRKSILTTDVIQTESDIDEINGFIWSDMQKHIPLYSFITIR